MPKSTALTVALILGLAGCDSDEPEDLMPQEAHSEPLTITGKPEDNRTMDDLLTAEMERRKARRIPADEAVTDNEIATGPGTGPGIATTTTKKCTPGVSTKTCRTPKPIKLSSKDKKKLFDRIAKDRKKGRSAKYDSRGIPIEPINNLGQPNPNH